MAKEIETLTEDERRALRGSKFAPLPTLPHSNKPKPRLAHPGGPVATNKAAALAKFLERKLKDPKGLASINPDLLELAVNKAKQTVYTSGTSNSGRNVRHVESFGDSDASEDEQNDLLVVKECKKKRKKKKQKKKNKKRKEVEDTGYAVMKKP